MKDTVHPHRPVLVHGNDRLTFSIALCLARSGEHVRLCTSSAKEALDYLSIHAHGVDGDAETKRIHIVPTLDQDCDTDLAIVITPEIQEEKALILQSLEAILSDRAIIAINTESIGLSSLQNGLSNPSRVLGLNWVEPAHDTLFLEIISNQITDPNLVERLRRLATDDWGKDPYVITGETGIRMQLFAAMVREAFFLVGEGYATVEDIDRACRNDAGYYLPFAGNLRYMDLMGTYAYGMVMKDLNPELATSAVTPSFFNQLIGSGANGMESGEGFYEYGPGESQKWQALFNRFSGQISALFDKYPFNYKTEEVGQASDQ